MFGMKTISRALKNDSALEFFGKMGGGRGRLGIINPRAIAKGRRRVLGGGGAIVVSSTIASHRHGQRTGL